MKSRVSIDLDAFDVFVAVCDVLMDDDDDFDDEFDASSFVFVAVCDVLMDDGDDDEFDDDNDEFDDDDDDEFDDFADFADFDVLVVSSISSPDTSTSFSLLVVILCLPYVQMCELCPRERKRKFARGFE